MTDEELQALHALAMQPCPRCGHVRHITAANRIVCSDPRCELIAELQVEVDRWRALAIERHHNLETVAEANQQLTAQVERLRGRVAELETAVRPIPITALQPKHEQRILLWDTKAQTWIVGGPWNALSEEDDAYLSIFYPYWLPLPEQPS